LILQGLLTCGKPRPGTSAAVRLSATLLTLPGAAANSITKAPVGSWKNRCSEREFSAYPEKLELTETILLNIILNIKPAERRAEKDKIGLFFEGANWGQYL